MAEEEPAVHAEPAVEGEAVELPADAPDAGVFEPPVPLTVRQHAPQAMPFPVAEETIAVATVGEPDALTTLGNSAEAFASGHASAPGPSWQEPLMEIAEERPEFVVAAAFAGGLLAAMILRRLGN